MGNILDSVKQQVESTAVREVSQRLGIDPTVAQQAVNAALPQIMGSLASRANSGAADVIHREATNQARSTTAANPLPQVLGDKHAEVEQTVRDATGLSRDDASRIISTIGPAVMRGIGEHVQREGINPGQLGNVLRAAGESAT